MLSNILSDLTSGGFKIHAVLQKYRKISNKDVLMGLKNVLARLEAFVPGLSTIHLENVLF